MPQDIETASPATYTARLHVVDLNERTGVPDYRTLRINELERPHFEAVAAATVHDTERQTTSNALLTPGLFVIDFPAVASPHAIGPDWLSHRKRQLYEHALELGQTIIARKILGDWPDTNMCTTHVATGDVSEQGKPEFISVSKLLHERPVTSYMGERALAFTIGTGRTGRTPAISAFVAMAAEWAMLGAKMPRPEQRADIKRIAFLQAQVATELLNPHPNYLLSSYSPAGGRLEHDNGRGTMPPVSESELAELAEQGIIIKDAPNLPRKAMSALLRLRLDKQYPDKSVLVMPYPQLAKLTPDELAESRRSQEAKLLTGQLQPPVC